MVANNLISKYLLFFPDVNNRRLVLLESKDVNIDSKIINEIKDYRFYRIQEAYNSKKLICYTQSKSSLKFKFKFLNVSNLDFANIESMLKNSKILYNEYFYIEKLSSKIEINNSDSIPAITAETPTAESFNAIPAINKNLNNNNSAPELNFVLPGIVNLINKTNPVKSVSENNIKEFIKNSYNIKPDYLKMSELKWKLLVRGVLRGDNILITGHRGEGKTVSVMTVAKILGRPLFKFNFGNMQDAQTALIGKTHLNSDGTFFAKSEFITAITTPNAVILLDELSRASDDAFNIMFSVLDSSQRYLRLNDDVNSPVVHVAPGVCFIATANIGAGYSSTRSIDIALRDRFTTKIEVEPLSIEDQIDLFNKLYESVSIENKTIIARLINEINKKYKLGELSLPTSTRAGIQMIALIDDEFSIVEAVEAVVLPDYSDDGDITSERVLIKQILQGLLTNGN